MHTHRLVLLVLAGVISGCTRWDDASIAESKQIGDEIIVALKAYHVDNESFPQSLDVLVPKYLAEVTTPPAGTRKWYYRMRAQSFTLSFAYDDDPIEYPVWFYEWKNGQGQWSLDH